MVPRAAAGGQGHRGLRRWVRTPPFVAAHRAQPHIRSSLSRWAVRTRREGASGPRARRNPWLDLKETNVRFPPRRAARELSCRQTASCAGRAREGLARWRCGRVSRDGGAVRAESDDMWAIPTDAWRVVRTNSRCAPRAPRPQARALSSGSPFQTSKPGSNARLRVGRAASRPSRAPGAGTCRRTPTLTLEPPRPDGTGVKPGAGPVSRSRYSGSVSKPPRTVGRGAWDAALAPYGSHHTDACSSRSRDTHQPPAVQARDPRNLPRGSEEVMKLAIAGRTSPVRTRTRLGKPTRNRPRHNRPFPVE